MDNKIGDILRQNNFYFKKKFGQNFITDTSLLDDIAQKSGASGKVVVEIGCGAGTLTRSLCNVAKKVYAFEVDENLKPILAQTLSGLENCEVIFKDFLKVDLCELENEIGEYIVVANLPYYITTPIIMRLIEESKKCTSLTIMVQDEVALRLCAKENTADYGAITAQIALRGDAKIIKKVGRKMFMPPPNVDSAVVKIDILHSRLDVKSLEIYRKTVKVAFANRRKTLENNLVQGFSFSRDLAKEIICSCGFSPTIRGEALSPSDFAKLSNFIYEKK